MENDNTKTLGTVSSLAVAGGTAGIAVASAAGIAVAAPAAIGGAICLGAYGLIELLKD